MHVQIDNRLIIFGLVPEGLKGADCKSAGYAYVGSNPTQPIMCKIHTGFAYLLFILPSFEHYYRMFFVDGFLCCLC